MPAEDYSLTFTGTVTQSGTIAVQPTSTTSLVMRSADLTMSGTVHDPPIPYEVISCSVMLGQNANNVSGTVCGRVVGVDL